MAGKVHVEGATGQMLLLLDLDNSYRLHVLQAETQMDMSAACGAYVVPEAQKTHWHTVSTIWQGRMCPSILLTRNMMKMMVKGILVP